jgi:uncharacterized protein (DUF1800 family)
MVAVAAAFVCVCLLAGCAAQSESAAVHSPVRSTASGAMAPANAAVLDRLSWGVDSATLADAGRIGLPAYLERQLHPGAAVLPAPVQEQIDAMTISQRPLAQLVLDLAQRRKAADGQADDEQKKSAQQAYQQEMNRLAREAASRSLMRDLYSPNQLQEQMTWFWMNHFSVHQGKANLRAMVGDYEENAIRPHALGRFRDLLAAVIHHPAMLRYLDNEQNALNHINENEARELMELHTLGVDGGYSQRDVQELARVLTGVGINLGTATPKVRPDLQSQYVRQGLFEFNPNRHDYGAKVLLGQPVKARGLAELDEALDRLSRHPATAHFISSKLALYFVGEAPPPALVERMAQRFLRSDGDIAATLATLFASPEFARSLGRQFKDPVHYAVSAVRLAYDGQNIVNTGPLQNWLNRMGEPLYGRQTPDGYALTASAWASAGQMATRFDVARAIGANSAGLFKTEGTPPIEQPAFPQLANAVYYGWRRDTLGEATRAALRQAATPQEWNMVFLSSPEMMNR